MKNYLSIIFLVAFLAIVSGHYRRYGIPRFRLPRRGGLTFQIGQPYGGGSWPGNGGYGYGGNGNIGYSIGGRGGYRGRYGYNGGFNGLLRRGSSRRYYYGGGLNGILNGIIGGGAGGLINQILRLVQGALSGGLRFPGPIIIGGQAPILGGINGSLGVVIQLIRRLVRSISRRGGLRLLGSIIFGGLNGILGGGGLINQILQLVSRVLSFGFHGPIIIGGNRPILGGINGGLGAIIQLVQRLLASISYGGGLNGQINLGGLIQQILSLIGGGAGGYYSHRYTPRYQIVYHTGFGPQIRSAGGKGLAAGEDDDPEWKEQVKAYLEQWKALRAKSTAPETKSAGGKGLATGEEDDPEWKEQAKAYLEQWKALRAKSNKEEKDI